MPTRRARHQVDQRPITLVLCFDADDWVDWCHSNGYQLITPSRMQRLDDPDARAAQRDDSRARRVATPTDAITGIGHDLVETDRFPSRDDADQLRLLASRQLRPRTV